jgi:hypothetical protein
MEADAPLPPNTMNVAAPEGTPPRRFECSFMSVILKKTALPSEAPTRRSSDPIKGWDISEMKCCFVETDMNRFGSHLNHENCPP